MISMSRKTPHVIGLDIIRAAAILMVLLSHCGSIFCQWEGWDFPWELAVGGFFGVTFFFALSGFLIGRILLDLLDRQPGFHDWLVFMQRRWLRTLPLYYLCLLLLSLFWRPRFWESDRTVLWHDLPWYLTLAQNLGWAPVDRWFDVSWSLTVEEWFYLGFSAILFAGARWIRRDAALAVTIGAFILVPLALRALLPASVDWGELTNKVVLLRLDAIAWGVLMAWMFRRIPAVQRWSGILFAAGLVCTIVNWNGAPRRMLHMPDAVWKPLVFDMTSIGCVLCMPYAALLERCWRPLERMARSLSAQSYALYLIHLDVLGIVSFYKEKLHLPNSLAIMITLAAMAGLSYLSYWYFERPILELRPVQGQAKN
jgi:peptidoglycan/LPS O-acetylase OafA/YrhL